MFLYTMLIDSKETAVKEIKFFFPNFDLTYWMENDEALFRLGKVYYNKDLSIHLKES